MQRYRHLPKNMEQTVEMMRSGIRKEITAHLASMEVSSGSTKVFFLHTTQKTQLVEKCSKSSFKNLPQAVPGQIESHLTGEVEESVLFAPFKDLEAKSNFSNVEVKRLQVDAKEIIKSEIRPAFRKLLR